MKKVTILLIAFWGVISAGVSAQSTLPRIMLDATEELGA